MKQRENTRMKMRMRSSAVIGAAFFLFSALAALACGGSSGGSSGGGTTAPRRDIRLQNGTCTGSKTEATDVNCRFTASLTERPSEDVTVRFAASSSLPGEARITNPAPLTFTSENWNATQSITVPIGDDSHAQKQNATITIKPSAQGYTAPDSISFTLADDDTSNITFRTMTCTGTKIEGLDNSCMFAVALLSQPSANVTVSFVTTAAPGPNSGDNLESDSEPLSYPIVTTGTTRSDSRVPNPSPATAAFTPTNWQTLQTINTIIGTDSIAKNEDTTIIITATPTSPGAGNGIGGPKALSFVLGVDTDNDRVIDSQDVDNDNDGLIDISSLTMLHNMRYNLSGTSYKRGTDGDGNRQGAPASATANCTTGTGTTGGNRIYLCGYELTQNLNFDADGDGATFQAQRDGDCDVILPGDDPTTKDIVERNQPRINYSDCTLDSNDHATYFNAPAEPSSGNYTRGWAPIGTSSRPFKAIFDGKGFTISNMSFKMLSASNVSAGFFGLIGSNARIRNVGLRGGIFIVATNRSNAVVGGLVGETRAGNIENSYAILSITASGRTSVAGGLVGENAGTVSSSYATGPVSSSGTLITLAAGLVGNNDDAGSLTKSYATGNVSASALGASAAGLAGSNSGSITTSYATGTVYSAGSKTSTLGASAAGLAGSNSGSITNSYATGDATSNALNAVSGGLVALNQTVNTKTGRIRNSYATGIPESFSNAKASAFGIRGAVSGGLVGFYDDPTIIANSFAAPNSIAAAAAPLSFGGWLVGRNESNTRLASYTSSNITNSYGSTATRLGTINRDYNGSAIAPGNFRTPSWYNAADRWNTIAPNTAWNFTTIWNPPTAGTNNGYPTLR